MQMGWTGALALAVIAIAPSACMAQSHWGGYGRHRDAYSVGYDRGLQEGERQGERDARRHERFNFRDERSYREAVSGYRHSYGARHRYTDGYRSGFERGYRRGYVDVRGSHDRRDWDSDRNDRRRDRDRGYDRRRD